MNTEEIMVAVYEALGDRSYLLPYTDASDPATFDISLTTSQKLLGWVNRGYQAVLSWKLRSGRIIRYRSKEDTVNFKTVVKTGTISSSYTDGNEPASYGSNLTDYVYLDSEYAGYDNYLSYIFEVTDGTGAGQRRFGVYTTSGWFVFNKALDTALDSTSEWKIYKRFYRIVPATDASAGSNINYQQVHANIDFLSALKVIDLKTNTKLGKGGRTETYEINNITTGVPTTFKIYNKMFVFDTSPDDSRWYQFDFIRTPKPLAAGTDEPEIPEAFHEAIVLWAIWWGYRTAQESEAAYAVKRDLQERMESIVTEFDMEHEYIDYHTEVVSADNDYS